MKKFTSIAGFFSKNLTLVIDNQMQLESEESFHDTNA